MAKIVFFLFSSSFQKEFPRVAIYLHKYLIKFLGYLPRRKHYAYVDRSCNLFVELRRDGFYWKNLKCTKNAMKTVSQFLADISMLEDFETFSNLVNEKEEEQIF
eukprot:TRINITY_DN9000_c0_g2_i1.p1 TRINITY_DN9000_c0_g2~~TRINITY_DN9000_c0_g2_i1.p1  ORF type:complete len:104 (+),score=30.27 TRINITY_DN9000_c0_g2_i1:50-361(+)